MVNDAALQDDGPTALELSFVAQVSERDCYMGAQGTYGQHSKKLFEKTKAVCYMVRPAMEPWAGDWDQVLGFFRWMEASQNRHKKASRGLFKDPARNSVRVVHDLFSVSSSCDFTQMIN